MCRQCTRQYRLKEMAGYLSIGAAKTRQASLLVYIFLHCFNWILGSYNILIYNLYFSGLLLSLGLCRMLQYPVRWSSPHTLSCPALLHVNSEILATEKKKAAKQLPFPRSLLFLGEIQALLRTGPILHYAWSLPLTSNLELKTYWLWVNLTFVCCEVIALRLGF